MGNKRARERAEENKFFMEDVDDIFNKIKTPEEIQRERKQKNVSVDSSLAPNKVEKQPYSRPLRLKNNLDKVENPSTSTGIRLKKDDNPNEKTNLIKVENQPYTEEIRLKNNLDGSKNNLIPLEKGTSRDNNETDLQEYRLSENLILDERLLSSHLQKMRSVGVTPTIQRLVIELYRLGERRQNLFLSVNFVQFAISVGISKSTARVASNLLKTIGECFDAFYPVKKSGTVILLKGSFFVDGSDRQIEKDIKTLLPYDFDPAEILGPCIVHAGVSPDDISRKLIRTIFQEQEKIRKEKSLDEARLFCTSVVVYAFSRGNNIRQPSAYLNAIFATGMSSVEENITPKEIETSRRICKQTASMLADIDEIGISDLVSIGKSWGYNGRKDRIEIGNFITDQVIIFLKYLHKELDLFRKDERKEMARMARDAAAQFTRQGRP